MGSRNQRDESLVIQNSNSNDGIEVDGGHATDNGTNTVTISNVAPAAVGTATISKWLPITDSVTRIRYYIPLWT